MEAPGPFAYLAAKVYRKVCIFAPHLYGPKKLNKNKLGFLSSYREKANGKLFWGGNNDFDPLTFEIFINPNVFAAFKKDIETKDESTRQRYHKELGFSFSRSVSCSKVGKPLLEIHCLEYLSRDSLFRIFSNKRHFRDVALRSNSSRAGSL